MEIVLGGVEVDAQRAYELGFVNHVVPPDQLLGKAQAVADNLASLPPVHLQQTKQLLRKIRPQPTPEVRALEREVRDQVAQLEDTRESMRAWVERRPPLYKGR
jgi:enoyl-CoA hydratase